MKKFAAAAAALVLAGCGKPSELGAPVIHYQENPQRLSDWSLFAVEEEGLRINPSSHAYALATPLFSDYAQKLRTLTLPDGEPLEMSDAEDFEYPVGATFTKTFYYATDDAGQFLADRQIDALGGVLELKNVRLIETRILVRRRDGWAALQYLWNDDQTDAFLSDTGAIIRSTLIRSEGRQEQFAYVAPDRNQCAACHAENHSTKELAPVGFKPRHLAGVTAYSSGVDQLDWLRMSRAVDFTAATRKAHRMNADWRDETATLDARARAYLDINCSHCHNATGAADTSGLDLTLSAAGPALGFCKTPIAAGRGAGGRRFDISPGAPDESIFIHRLASTDPGVMMPELGRSLAHEEAVALVADWIASLEGECT